MNIDIVRDAYFIFGTYGHITYTQIPTTSSVTMYTVERPWLNNQHVISCVPLGVYSVKKYPSPHLGYTVWLLDVLNRDKIEIHIADYPTDVEGCIGVGRSLSPSYKPYIPLMVTDSKLAFADFMKYTGDRLTTVTIKNSPLLLGVMS